MKAGKFCNDLQVTLQDVKGHDHIEIGDMFGVLIGRDARDGRRHYHFHKTNEADAKECLEILEKKYAASTAKADKPDFNSVIFRSRLAVGDALMMTAGIRDFHRAFPSVKIGVHSVAMHIWDNNPYISNIRTADKEFNIGTGYLTNKSNSNSLHMANAYRISIQNETGLQFDQGPIKPDIWLTRAEFDAPCPIEGPYWIICIGGETGWTSKMWPLEYWQELVDSMPDIKFVHIGAKEHVKVHGTLKNNKGNVIDWVGKTQDPDTGIRDLFKLFLHAEGSVGLVSMHMHLSAAFDNPCVVIAGAREPMWFTHYMGHQYLECGGCLPCAKTKACWATKTLGDRCKKWDKKDSIGREIPLCAALISPADVKRAIERYYEGGRLSHEKPKDITFSNIVEDNAAPPKTREGMRFTGATISRQGWDALEEFMDKTSKKTSNIKVLEYGPGLSTQLFKRYGRVESIEAEPDKYNIGLDTLIEKPSGKYTLAFIDGPRGANVNVPGRGKVYNRILKIEEAMKHTNCIIVHNAYRAPIDEYLRNTMEPTGWQRRDLHVDRGMVVMIKPIKPKGQKKPESPVIKTSKGAVTIMTTCRGFGGSERSTLMIAKMLVAENFDVTIDPCGGTMCNAYRAALPNGVRIGKIPACDHLLWYTSDLIYNERFDELGEAIFNNPATRDANKSLILNYRLGRAGKSDWSKQFDHYAFLNSQKAKEFLQRVPGANTHVIPPPIDDIEKFLAVKPDYGNGLRIVRHSSQGDAKWPKDSVDVMSHIHDKTEAVFHLMPAPSWLVNSMWVYKYSVNQIPVEEFLSRGNLFLYLLPPKYQDQGPRVIMEAMLAGLPVVASWGYGASDRIIPGTGFTVEGDPLPAIQACADSLVGMTKMGQAAKEHARVAFDPKLWIKELIYGEDTGGLLGNETV